MKFLSTEKSIQDVRDKHFAFMDGNGAFIAEVPAGAKFAVTFDEGSDLHPDNEEINFYKSLDEIKQLYSNPDYKEALEVATWPIGDIKEHLKSIEGETDFRNLISMSPSSRHTEGMEIPEGAKYVWLNVVGLKDIPDTQGFNSLEELDSAIESWKAD